MALIVPQSFHPVPRAFYERPTLEIAPDLLGHYLIVLDGRSQVGGRIVEVEAYIGEDDPACHAFRGRTRRNEVMYGPPGRAYVYFTYGTHWMLNVVTEREGFPAALLIRALEPKFGVETISKRRHGISEGNWTNGPGKLTAALGITDCDNGLDLRASRLLIPREFDPPEAIGRSGRIGVSEGGDLPWRFFDSDSACVSLYRSGMQVSRRTPRKTNDAVGLGTSPKGKR